MLQWRPRLFALIAALALLVIAIVGGYGEGFMLILYW